MMNKYECIDWSKYFVYNSAAKYGLVSIKTGKPVGFPINRNERPIAAVLKHNTKLFYIHRIIYLMLHKNLPEYMDHIDGNPLNNTIENLRPVTIKINNRNKRKNSNNTTGTSNITIVRNSYAVCFSTNNGRKRRYFSIRKYGEEMALELCKNVLESWKQQKIDEGYTQRHGN